MCGGSGAGAVAYDMAQGLSPRVRGKRCIARRRSILPRSIPACAGEALTSLLSEWAQWVYPRVCGGSSWACSLPNLVMGLSPRVRGKRGGGLAAVVCRGSIPACAGEAGRPASGRLRRAVYPRVCGGSSQAVKHRRAFQGLSPRVRGKRQANRARQAQVGSIPACAGEASASSEILGASEVYPRVCGGSRRPAARIAPGMGLSPRVRGKRRIAEGLQGELRSIPACAGEAPPPRPRPRPRPRPVYPRVCGGSPVRLSSPDSSERSIPACAGEAVSGRPAARPAGVYPRVCGGSAARPAVAVAYGGLSPRVRGKLAGGAAAAVKEGSIPACAGEAPLVA